MVCRARSLFRCPVSVATFGVLLSALLVTACSGDPSGADPKSARKSAGVPVTVSTVAEQAVPLQLRAIGNVQAYSAVTVRAQINGELFRIHFQEGQDVKKGDLLFTIDPRPFEATLAQLQANVERDTAQAQ